MNPDAILDQMVAMYAQATPAVLGRVAPLLVPLYVLFFTVQFGWDLVRWTFAGTANALGLAARKILVFLLTYGLLIMLPLWLPAILAGWEWLGRTATGLPGLSPSSIFEQGLSLALSMFDSWAEVATLALAPVGTFRTLAALIVLVAFGAAALQLARVLVEASVARAVELSSTRYCPVSAMLGKTAEVVHKYTIEDGAPSPTGAPGGY